jgi:hypothetical protein
VSAFQKCCNVKNKTKEGVVKKQWLCVTRCSTALEGEKGWLVVMRLTAGRVSGFGIREEQKERNKKTSRKGKKLGCSRAESPGIWLETSTSDLRSLKSLEVGRVGGERKEISGCILKVIRDSWPFKEIDSLFEPNSFGIHNLFLFQHIHLSVVCNIQKFVS